MWPSLLNRDSLMLLSPWNELDKWTEYFICGCKFSDKSFAGLFNFFAQTFKKVSKYKVLKQDRYFRKLKQNIFHPNQNAFTNH